MALPKLKVPTHELIQPSTSKTIKFRPFMADEEKVLLMAKEAKDDQQMINAMRDLVKACTFGKVDMNKIPTFDLEYMFVQLRARSVAEKSLIRMICQNPVPVVKPIDASGDADAFLGDEVSGSSIKEDFKDTKACGGEIPFEIDLLNVEVVRPEGHSKTIVLDEDDKIGIILRYPEIGMLEELDENDEDKFSSQISILIESVFEGETVTQSGDASVEDMKAFLSTFRRPHYRKIKQTFFDTMPVLRHDHPYECPKCGVKNTKRFEGVKDFF